MFDLPRNWATNAVRGPLVELGRTAELLDVPLVHDGDRVGHRHRLFLVVRDVDERDLDLVLDPLELQLQLLAELQVERSERLVEEQHPRTVDERARQRHPLLLTTGELLRLAVLATGEVDELEHVAHAFLHVRLAHLAALETECDVLVDGHVREQRVALEHRVDVALVGRQADHVAVAEVDRTRRRLLESADHPQGRRLAAPRRPEQREERAVRDLE